jgi:hypothetical protein
MLGCTFLVGLLLSIAQASSVYCTVGAGDGSSLYLSTLDLVTGRTSVVANWTSLGGGLSGHTFLHYPGSPSLSVITLNTQTLQNYIRQTTEKGVTLHSTTTATAFVTQEITQKGDLFVVSSFNKKGGIGQVNMQTGVVEEKMTFSAKQPTFVPPGVSAYDPTNDRLHTVILDTNDQIFVSVDLQPPYSATYTPTPLLPLALEYLNSTHLVGAAFNSTTNQNQVVAIQVNPFSYQVLASLTPNLPETSGASMVLDNAFYFEIEDSDGNKPVLTKYDFRTKQVLYLPLFDNVLSVVPKKV